MTENQIAALIVDVAYKLHSQLGHGLFESVYEELFAYDLIKRGLDIERQKEVPVIYDGKKFGVGFRIDLIANDKVIVELKSIEQLTAVHKKQILTYLRLTDKRLGLLINFGEAYIKNGIIRVVNNLVE